MATTTETGIANDSTRKAQQELRQRDEFYKETYRFFDTLAHHRTAVLVAAVALVSACIAGGIVMNRREAHGEAAKSALFLAEKAYETELKSLAGVKEPSAEDENAEKADAADEAKAAVAKDAAKDSKEAKEKAAKAKAKEEALKAKREQQAAANKKMEELSFSKLDVDAKFPESVKKYNEVISKFDGTRAAVEARMSLGTLYFNHGQAEKAVPIFQALGNSAHAALDRAMAFQSLGYALENDGKLPEALAAYEKALNYSEGSIKGDVWLGVARVQETMHDSAKARSTYDQIINQLPNTDAAKTAESLKAHVK